MPTGDISTAASVFSIIGTVSSQLLNLSALPSMIEIHKARSTLLYPAFPFIIGFAANLNNIAYCFLTKQYIVLISAGLSLSFNLSYLTVHLVHSKDRGAIFRLLGFVVMTLAIASGIGPLFACLLGDSDSCEPFAVTWLGVVNVVVFCVVYCGQLWTLRDVIRTKNSASISPWLTAGVTFCAVMWTTYSCLAPDYFFLASSIVGISSSLFQIYLLIRYPRIMPNTDNPELVQITPGK